MPQNAGIPGHYLVFAAGFLSVLKKKILPNSGALPGGDTRGYQFLAISIIRMVILLVVLAFLQYRSNLAFEATAASEMRIRKPSRNSS